MTEPVLTWDKDGLPHSVLFDDKYFCKENGYEETLYVSCGGNRLQERFSQLNPDVPGTFTIVEAGFGTGLNFCCAFKIWQDMAPKSWTLNFISLDKYPVSTDQLSRALSLWPLLEQQRRILATHYVPASEGIKEFYFQESNVRLTIVFEDVLKALEMMHTLKLAHPGADAIFFDGFAPAKNPDMWHEDVFGGMAKLSKQDTTFATFTVAGWVRRGLESKGFTIHKAKGYGTKKHILIGTFKGLPK